MNKNKFFKQYNIKGIGTLINVLYMTAPMLGIVGYFVNFTTLYSVTAIHKFVSLPIFLGMMVVFVFVMLFLFYKFIYPSYYAFLNKQTYIHENPIQKDLKKIKEKLGINDE